MIASFPKYLHPKPSSHMHCNLDRIFPKEENHPSKIDLVDIEDGSWALHDSDEAV